MASFIGSMAEKPASPPVSAPAVVSAMEVPVLTAAMLSEAAEAVLDSADSKHKDMLKRMWTMDANSDAARAYFRSQVEQRSNNFFTKWFRPVVVIDEVLTQEEVMACTRYAPEFEISFQNRVSHDHGLFSAMRKLDQRLLQSQNPPGVRCIDYGGNYAYHARSGHTNVVSVTPIVDAKDAMRYKLRQLELRQMMRAGNHPTATEVERVSGQMAASILAEEGVYHVDTTAQKSTVQAPVSMSNHVYDIPMKEWPRIMERAGSLVHNGKVHFSNDFFERDSGVLQFSGARYEIDRVKDTFQMGLGQSVSNWYEHEWSDYMRYGAQQILHGDKHVYSYKITERRGDTISFRILQVDPGAKVNREQVYELPGVRMVEVAGFEVAAPSVEASSLPGSFPQAQGPLRPRKYLFPEKLWNMMLTQATMDVERGGLDYQKLTNFYRTVVPRQTINSVVVSGGEKVALDDVKALVVMAGTVATMDSLLLQRTMHANTDTIMAERSQGQEMAIVGLLRAFLGTAVRLGHLALSPLEAVARLLTNTHFHMLKASLVTWRPVPRCKIINAAHIVDNRRLGRTYVHSSKSVLDISGTDEPLPVDSMLEVWKSDPAWAQDALDVCGDILPDKVASKLRDVVDVAQPTPATPVKAETVQVQPAAPTAPPSYVSVDPATLELRRASRVNAIREAIVESTMDGAKLEAASHGYYARLVRGGVPDVVALRKACEEMGNPDLWETKDGVLLRSVYSEDTSSFRHSGVYTPVPDAAGSYLRAVAEVEWVGINRDTGEEVRRSYWRIADDTYTGLCLTLDELLVFNGPEIRATLQLALQMPASSFDYGVVVKQGPPGCGKTTSIVRSTVFPRDCVLCPVRASSMDTREKLVEAYPQIAVKQWRTVCRTLDSLLVNWATLPSEAKTGFSRILADEVYMAPSGKWHAAAVLLGVSEFVGYGDTHQIEHKPRVDAPKFHVKIQADRVDEEFRVHRGARQIVAGWAGIYKHKIRTTNRAEGEFRRVKSLEGVTLMKDCVALCMYQADKKTIKQYFANSRFKPKIMTTHESEGKTFDQTVIFNYEYRKRSSDDTFYLFSKREYALVASSRSRLSVLYVKLSDEPDEITSMIALAADPRRQSAVVDMATEGVSVEFK